MKSDIRVACPYCEYLEDRSYLEILVDLDKTGEISEQGHSTTDRHSVCKLMQVYSLYLCQNSG